MAQATLTRKAISAESPWRRSLRTLAAQSHGHGRRGHHPHLGHRGHCRAPHRAVRRAGAKDRGPPQPAFGPASFRHRRTGARCVQPGGVWRADFAARRSVGHFVCDTDGRIGRSAGGLHRRRVRSADHAPGRHHAGLSVHRAGAGDCLRAGAEPEECPDRHDPGLVARVRAPDARAGAQRQERRVRGGGAGRWARRMGASCCATSSPTPSRPSSSRPRWTRAAPS